MSMPLITLRSGNFGWDYIIQADTGRTVYIQTDQDYPGVASTFGWVPCECGTDGTVDCEHKTADNMIQSAQEYLDEHADCSEWVEDPGYFA